MTALAVTLALFSKRTDKRLLLSANIEALTQDETLSPGEYHEGIPGTNWQWYTLTCTAYGQTNYSSQWAYDASLGIYYVSAGAGASGGSSQSGNYAPYTYYKDVCGKGAGVCWAGAPDGHPCA